MKKKPKCAGYTGPRPQPFITGATNPLCRTCGVAYSKHKRPPIKDSRSK